MHRRVVLFALLTLAACRESGSGERVSLRYRPPAGAVYRYSLEQKTLLSMESGPFTGMGKQQLVMRMHFTQRVKGPADGGGTEVHVTFDSTTMEMPGVRPEVIAQELARMRGLQSTVVLDERAQVLRTNFSDVTNVPPEIRNQLAAGIKAMTFAFPEQPMGKGDSWTIDTDLPMGQLPGTDPRQAGPAHTTLTVREIRVTGADTSVVLGVKTEFPSGPIALDMGGQKATLKLSGALAGDQEFSLSRGAVVTATMAGAMKMHLTSASFGSQSMVVSSDTQNALRLLGP